MQVLNVEGDKTNITVSDVALLQNVYLIPILFCCSCFKNKKNVASFVLFSPSNFTLVHVSSYPQSIGAFLSIIE